MDIFGKRKNKTFAKNWRSAEDRTKLKLPRPSRLAAKNDLGKQKIRNGNRKRRGMQAKRPKSAALEGPKIRIKPPMIKRTKEAE